MLILTILACQGIGRTAIKVMDKGYAAPAGDLQPSFDSEDKDILPVSMVKVAEGLEQITDLQFLPDGTLVVLQKTGEAKTVNLADGTVSDWFSTPVVTVSEQGLLGLALHPDYANNGRIFVNSTPKGVRPEVTRIAEWSGSPPTQTKVLLDVRQPYQNHNAGQLQFGPDGMLYIGMGDGGLRADPDGNGQNAATHLGAMLRIDVDGSTDGKPYGIPADNPKKAGWAPENWAIGLRNPWRYSFDPSGRLVVADVGQDAWEEVTVVSAGSNQGWPIREGKHCFPPSKNTCQTEGLNDPIFEYPRHRGQSITGGYVYTASTIPKLTGLYVVGDFLSGRIWAVDLATGKSRSLGKWPVLISTFGRDASGEIYVADYGKGTIYKIVPDQ